MAKLQSHQYHRKELIRYFDIFILIFILEFYFHLFYFVPKYLHPIYFQKLNIILLMFPNYFRKFDFHPNPNFILNNQKQPIVINPALFIAEIIFQIFAQLYQFTISFLRIFHHLNLFLYQTHFPFSILLLLFLCLFMAAQKILLRIISLKLETTRFLQN